MFPVLDRNARVMDLSGEYLVLKVLRNDGEESLVIGTVVKKAEHENEDHKNEEI